MTADPKKNEKHRLPHAVESVAVIGAGYSGVVAAAHLSACGLSVRVFERSASLGGVWRYDDAIANDSPYPQQRPEVPSGSVNGIGLGINGDSSDASRAEREHAPPGPCYAGLKSNVPVPLMRSTVVAWPPGTPDFGVFVFDTAVTRVWKPLKAVDAKWNIRTRILKRSEPGEISHVAFEEREHQFDALVCASGHYNFPNVPNIPGLAAWKDKFPTRVRHSKQYRSAGQSGATLRGMNLLVIGGSVSSLDIVREAVAAGAGKVYQSSRGGVFDLSNKTLPQVPSVRRVAGVVAFEMDDVDITGVRNSEKIPGTVRLEDGTGLRDIDHVILATGYLRSYPYLGSRLQQPCIRLAEVRRTGDEEIIVTAEGAAVNLYNDMFYISDPTLAFVGVPIQASTFSLYDVQAQFIARVFIGQVKLPSRAQMTAEYARRWENVDKADESGGQEEARVAKTFNSMIGHEVAYIEELVAWINAEAIAAGGTPAKGLDAAWHGAYAEFAKMVLARRSGKL